MARALALGARQTTPCAYLGMSLTADSLIESNSIRSRKKPSGKVYPKGYAEKLEQQQSQLVAGLQDLYHRLVMANAWNGSTLPELHGHPLTHDILAALDLLKVRHDSEERQSWDEDSEKCMSATQSDYTALMQRNDSFVWGSEYEQVQSKSNSTPTPSAFAARDEDFMFRSQPWIQSPTLSPEHWQPCQLLHRPPLQQEPKLNEHAMFYSATLESLETEVDLSRQWNGAMEFSELDSGLGVDDASILTTWDKWDQPDHLTAISQGTQHLIDALEWLPNGYENLDTFRSFIDLDFMQFVTVA